MVAGVRVEVRVAGLQWPGVRPQLSQPLVALRGGTGQQGLAVLPWSESTVGPFCSRNATYFSRSAYCTHQSREEPNRVGLNENSLSVISPFLLWLVKLAGPLVIFNITKSTVKASNDVVFNPSKINNLLNHHLSEKLFLMVTNLDFFFLT